MSSCSVLPPQQRATLQARIQAELARRGLQAPVPYAPRGAAAALQASQAPQIVVSGPAGTGKSRACLEKLHRLAQEVPRLRALIVRKTRVSLTESALLTFEQTVLGPAHPLVIGGPQRAFRRAYDYPNGSSLVVGGLDNPTKLMSTEYDLIYVQEATELSENDWEALSTRLRNGRLSYQQILGDCNPDAPTHWLRRRHETGRTPMLESRHEDNPRLHDGTDWTAEGRAYMAVLEALTGVRLQRLRYGRWAAAEGAVYEEFDHAVHVIAPFEVPASWRRIRSIDFGYSNPFVCQWWAIDGDGRMYLYREVYMSQRLVADHARMIEALSAGERIEQTVADHDAEDRATLVAAGIPTVAACKEISPGIQAVQQRLRVAGDGRPRLFIMRECLVERDELLAAHKKPVCTEQEVDGYMWPRNAEGKAVKEVPVDVDNHGCDAMRYAVAYADELNGATLPFSWYRSSATFRAEVLGEPPPRPTEAGRPAEPGTAPAAQAPATPAALPYQWLRPGGSGAMTAAEREAQRWLDLVEGRGWRD